MDSKPEHRMRTWVLVVIAGIVLAYLGGATDTGVMFGIGVIVAFAGICAVALTLATDYDTRRAR